ncbi:hypothetical protein KDN24_06465 [Bacillus sp. Bva_UNVM-123]|uniref:hypothetical protein n=1 Tax=Bacillus sp. Bva_UNVM-123 TaxID=2829798 RepID=UPI00391F6415
MKIKCGRDEFELNEKDIIMYNGACYQLLTREVRNGWHSHSPVLAKAKAEKLIKTGDLKEVKLEKSPYKDNSLIYYSI